MAQQNEQNHSLDPATAPVKRKRGRPRKDEVPGSDPGGRTQKRRRNLTENSGQGIVGQMVSGILDGVFDAGFLITVRVGNGGPLLRGMVFDSHLAVPVSAANDIAPHIKMSKRDEIPISPVPPSGGPPHRRGSSVHTPIANRIVVNNRSQGSILKMEGSEAVISSAPVTVKVSDNQGKGLTADQKPDVTSHPGDEAAGEPNLDLTSKKPTENETVSDPKLDLTIQKTISNETVSEMKPDSTSEQSRLEETVGEPMLDPTSHQSPCNETIGEPKLGPISEQCPGNETTSELKSDSTTPKSPGNETISEPKSDSTSQKSAGNEAVSEQKSDSQSWKSAGNEAVSEQKSDSPSWKSAEFETEDEPKLDSKSETSHPLNVADQPPTSTAAVPKEALISQVSLELSKKTKEALISQASSEVLEETKMNSTGDDNNQMPPN